MSCPYKRKEKKRLNNSKTTLPLQFRDISKKEFRTLSFDNIHKFYTTAHAINLENHNFRKILYDAFFDALENKHGKIHRRDYLNEIEKFNNRYYQVADANDIEKIQKWKEYRESLEYQEFLKQVRQIDRLDHRADITISNALAYMYSQHQDKNLIYGAVEALEEKLKLNKIPELWSKGSLWFIANVAFFEQLSFLTKIGKIPIAVDTTQFIVHDLGLDIGIELKARKDWWESKFYYDLTDNEKLFYRIYNDVISVSAGETGSVWLAEAARAGTSLALHYGAKVLTNIATLHPAFRALKVGSYIMEGVKDVLNNTVLGWIGWQVAVEWSLDGWIQSTMHRIGEALYRFTEGELFENAWNFTKIRRSERYELMKDYFSEYKNLYEKLVNYYRSHKSLELREEIMKSLDRFYNYGDILGVRERTEKLVNKFFAKWRAFEARFRLHEFYEHTKRDYEYLKSYYKKDLQDLNKSIKVYCTTSNEKNALNLINNQKSLLFTKIRTNVNQFKKLTAIHSIELLDYHYYHMIPAALEVINKHVENAIKFIDNLINQLANGLIKDRKETTYNTVLSKVFTDIVKISNIECDFNIGVTSNISCRLLHNHSYSYDFDSQDYDYHFTELTDKHKINSLDFYISMKHHIDFLRSYAYCAGYDGYFHIEHSYILQFRKKSIFLNKFITGLTLDDIRALSFSYITDFKHLDYFLDNLKDKVDIYIKNEPLYTKEYKLSSKLLRYVQRNKCFSIKKNKNQIKRITLYNPFLFMSEYNFSNLEVAKALFLVSLFDKYYMYFVKPSYKGYEYRNSFEYKHLIDKSLRYTRNIIPLSSGQLDFYLKIYSTVFKKAFDYKKSVLINFVNNNSKYDALRKGKRSKVLCFVSSQK